MTPDLDTIMQAAERCDALFESTSVDFENMPVECIRDLFELAKSYRRILPKGKRPVAITEYEAWRNVWWIDEWFCVRPGCLLPSAGINQWSIKNSDKGITQWLPVDVYKPYATEADAELERQWRLFDMLLSR